MTPSPGNHNNILQERLNALSQAVAEGFVRIEKLLASVDDRVRLLETSAIADLAVQKSRLDAAFILINENKKNTEDVRKDLENRPSAEDVKKIVDEYPRIKDTISGVRWLAATVTGLILTLIYGMITGSIKITMFTP